MDLSGVPPAIWGAMIALAGAAIIVPFLNRYVWGSRTRLRAEVVFGPTKLPTKATKQLRGSSAAFVGDEAWGFYGFPDATQYALVTIHNDSKKLIKGVTLSVASASGWVQVEDGEELSRAGGNVVVGDILPGQSRTAHMWLTGMLFTDFGTIKRSISVTAEEFDSIRVRYPMPRYVYQRLRDRAFNVLTVVFWVAFCIIILAQAYYAIRK